jgi:predicted nucleic acid-binding Zn ribbon protein
VNIVENLRERRLLDHPTRAWRRTHHACLVCTSDAQDGEELCSACREELRSNWLADTDRRMVKATAKCRGDSTSRVRVLHSWVATAPITRT